MLFCGHLCSFTVHTVASFFLSGDRQTSTARCPSTAHRKHGQRADNSNEYKNPHPVLRGGRKIRGMSTSYVTSFVTNAGKQAMSNFISFTSIYAMSGYIIAILNWTPDGLQFNCMLTHCFGLHYKTNVLKALSEVCPKSNKYLIPGPWFLVFFVWLILVGWLGFFRNINTVTESLYIHWKKTGIFGLLSYSGSLFTL